MPSFFGRRNVIFRTGLPVLPISNLIILKIHDKSLVKRTIFIKEDGGA